MTFFDLYRQIFCRNGRMSQYEELWIGKTEDDFVRRK
jgi:hypothetical protein